MARQKHSQVAQEIFQAFANGCANGSITDVQATMREVLGMAVEQMLKGELDAHLGYSKSSQGEKQTADRRNGYSCKTIKTNLGETVIDVPRDRDGSFEPKLLGTYKTDLCGIDNKIYSLYGMGMSQADIAKTISEIYNCDISQPMVSCVIARLTPVVQEWRNRKLESVYAVVYVDCIYVGMNSQEPSQPASKHAVYVIMGITMEGKKDILGLWIDSTESKSKWLNILDSLKERGVEDIFFMCMDGVSGLEEGVKTIFPNTVVQRCIVHIMRNSLEFIPTKAYKAFCDSIKTVYSAVDRETAMQNFQKFKELWGKKYPGAVKCWERNLEGILQLFNYPSAIRKLIYTTNAIESTNSSLRKVTKKGAFESSDAVYRALYLRILTLKEKWDKSRVQNWTTIKNELLQLPLTKERMEKLVFKS